MALNPPIKRLGMTTCDNCGREFEAKHHVWRCPYCDFDNSVGHTFMGAYHYGKDAPFRDYVPHKYRSPQ